MNMFQISNKRAKKINVSSFDMDQCIFNPDYNWSPHYSSSEVIDRNRALLDYIKSQAIHYHQLIAFVGSARQTKKMDTFCAMKNKTESAFTAIKKIANYLGARLDNFLLADIYFNLPDGTSFQRAIDEDYSGEHAIGPNDETKFTLLYAQIHKVANQYPNDEIIFDFYDDGGSIKGQILYNLHSYFFEMPDKLPNNVILNLIHYEGKETTIINSILGTGFIDTNYRRTVQAITQGSRQSIGCDFNVIKASYLRLDEQMFIYRKPLKRSLSDDTLIAIEPTAALAENIPATEDRSLNLTISMMQLFWDLLIPLINYFSGTRVEVEDSDNALNYHYDLF